MVLEAVVITGYLSDHPVIASYHNVYKRIKYRHTHDHGETLDSLITYEECVHLMEQPCFYCGRPPSIPILNDAGETVGYKNTIDRVDSRIGYRLKNCVPSCPHCNYAKNAQTVDQFLSLVKSIYEHNKLDEFEAIELNCSADGFLKTMKR